MGWWRKPFGRESQRDNKEEEHLLDTVEIRLVKRRKMQSNVQQRRERKRFLSFPTCSATTLTPLAQVSSAN